MIFYRIYNFDKVYIYLCLYIIKSKIMARKVNYIKKIEKIKSQLDELTQDIEKEDGKEVVEAAPKIKVSDLDFEGEDLQSLLKIQTRLTREIQKKI